MRVGRLHPVCTTSGIPIASGDPLLPAGLHDLTPLYADKGDNGAADKQWLWREAELRLVPHRKRNTWPNEWDDARAVQEERHTIETDLSHRAAMGIERLYVRTVAGLELKVHAALLALTYARAA